MHQIIEELRALSPNHGGGVSSEDLVCADLLASAGAVLTAARAGDVAALEGALERTEATQRIVLLGETILAAAGDEAEQVDALRGIALTAARKLASEFEADSPEDSGDEALLVHAIAAREWAQLLALQYEPLGRWAHLAEALMVRARMTNCALSRAPHLVGEAMVDVAEALERIDSLELAARCYRGVALDLEFAIERAAGAAAGETPTHEIVVCLHWLRRARRQLERLSAADLPAADDDTLDQLCRAHPHAPSNVGPRFGPIARTYLAPTPFLARGVAHLFAEYSEADRDACVATICHRFGCWSSDVEFYISAMGSYELRDTILRGVKTSYDRAHEEVFAAIELVKTRG